MVAEHQPAALAWVWLVAFGHSSTVTLQRSCHFRMCAWHVPTPTACGCRLAGSVLLLRELDRQARQQGGAVYMLNGNHESLNVAGDFR